MTPAGLRRASFVGVPVDLYVEVQIHNDAVGRDLLLAVEAGTASEYADRLAALVGPGDRLLAARDSMRAQVDAARAAGATHVDVHADFLPGDIAAAADYLRLVEEADDLVARGVILVPPPSADVRALRRWLTEELIAQVIDGVAPTPYRPPGA